MKIRCKEPETAKECDADQSDHRARSDRYRNYERTTNRYALDPKHQHCPQKFYLILVSYNSDDEDGDNGSDDGEGGDDVGEEGRDACEDSDGGGSEGSNDKRGGGDKEEGSYSGDDGDGKEKDV